MGNALDNIYNIQMFCLRSFEGVIFNEFTVGVLKVRRAKELKTFLHDKIVFSFTVFATKRLTVS